MTMNSETATERRRGELDGNVSHDGGSVQPIVIKDDIYQDVEDLKRALAVQAATHEGALATQAAAQAGALATATAAQTGADATLAATQAGAVAAQTAMQAGHAAATSAALIGLWSTLVGSVAALVAGIFLGAHFIQKR